MPRKTATKLLSWLSVVIVPLNSFLLLVGEAHGTVWLGALSVGIWTLLCILLASSSGEEASFLWKAVVFGLCGDAILWALNLIVYNTPSVPPLPSARIFTAFLWLNLVTSFSTCLRGMTGRYALGAVVGFIAGPVICYLADGLGTLTLARPLYMPLAVASVVYGAVIPMILDLHACAHKSQHSED